MIARRLRLRTVVRATAFLVATGAIIAGLAGCAPSGPADRTAEEAAGSYLQALSEGRLKDALQLTAAEMQPADSSAIKNSTPPKVRMTDVEVIEAVPGESGAVVVYFRYALGKQKLKSSVPVTSALVEGDERWRVAEALPALDLSVLQEYGTPVVEGTSRNGEVQLAPGVYTVAVDPDSPFVEATKETTATVTMDGSSLADDEPRSRLSDDAGAELAATVGDAVAGCGTACVVAEDGASFSAFTADVPESTAKIFRIDPKTNVDAKAFDVDSLRRPTKATITIPAQVYRGCFFGCQPLSETGAWHDQDVEFTIALSETDIGAVAVDWGY